MHAQNRSQTGPISRPRFPVPCYAADSFVSFLRPLCLLSLCLAPAISAAWAEPVRITLTDIESTEGILRVAVCSEQSYRGAIDHNRPCEINLGRRPQFDQVSWIADVPKGTWAFVLFHDQNGDGISNRLGFLPTEGVGYSNNPRFLFGIPEFDDVAVNIPHTTEIVIETKYF